MKQRAIFIFSLVVLLAIGLSSCRSKQLCPAYLTENANNTEIVASVEN